MKGESIVPFPVKRRFRSVVLTDDDDAEVSLGVTLPSLEMVDISSN